MTNAECQTEVIARWEDFSFRYPEGEKGGHNKGSAQSDSSAQRDSFSLGPLSFEVKKGDFVLLVGETGCGKTTLLRCCKPEIAPEGTRAGHLTICGKEIDARDKSRQFFPEVGYVFQNPENQAVCSEVWHELAFGLENIGMEPGEMRRRVAEVAHFLGIESWLHKETAHLSGGQKQILNIASVLVMNPSVLLLDEPTSQLDPIAESTVLHALFRLNRELGITIIVATHQIEALAPYANTIARLSRAGIKARPLSECPEYTQRAFCETGKAGETYDSHGEAEKNSAALSLRDVTFSYERKGAFVLRGCSFAFQKGTINALVGSNGCGKTTALKLLAGSLKPVRGQVKNELRTFQGYIPQDPKALFVKDSVEEEVLEWQHSSGYSADEAREMLEKFGLAPLASLHPFDLSGGQQQVLAFCKVILTKPQLLLIDEPTKGLDVTYKTLIGKILCGEAEKGTTIVLCSHDLSFVNSVADTATMLFDGQVACSEPTSQFFQGNFFYRPLQDEFSRSFVK
ncbi:MAG: ABC transporter ATP-binding protein [Anaerotardibacter sp.]